jgi:hypothetical protein
MEVQPLRGQVFDRIRSREIAESHFVAELSNTPNIILTSMKSYDPLRTTVVVPEPSGLLHMVCCTTRDQQRTFYATSRARSHMVNVDVFTSVGGDWYGFVHGTVTSEALETSKRFTSELLGILPATVDEDTIAGEIGLGWPFGLEKMGDAPGEPALERVATLKAHNAWLDAFRLGDPESIASLYTDGAQFAMRNPVDGEISAVEGRSAIVGYYGNLLARTKVTSVDVVMRIIDRWFVFTELLVGIDHPARGHTVTRMADVCVMGTDNRIMVHLGTAPDPDE